MSAASAQPARSLRTALSAHLRGWLARRVIPQTITWTLLGSIAALLSYNFSHAAWVPDSSPLANAVWGGLFMGALLAASRFPGWAAAVYHFSLSNLLLGLWIGKILPPLGQIAAQAPLATLELVHIRLLSYLDRLSGWVSAYAAGGNIQDNGLFQLLIGLLLWGASAWLAWAALRRQRPLDGLLPVGLVLGVNTYLSDQPVDALWLFLGCAALLAARTAMLEAHHGWERRRVDFPDELSWSWSSSALVLALIILFAARLSPLFGTPQGWKTLGDLFRDAQKRLEVTTTRLFGDVATSPPHLNEIEFTPEPLAQQAETPEMGIIGLAPKPSNAVVMWVKTSDPPPPEPEPDQPVPLLDPGLIHYWRSSIFGSYTGRGWNGLNIADTPPLALEIRQLPTVQAAPPTATPGGSSARAASPVAGRRLLSQEFEIVARHERELFAAAVPAGTLISPAPGQTARTLLRYAGPEATPLVYADAGAGAAASSYSVQSWVTDASDVLLRAAPTSYPPEIAAAYLQLPSSLPQRVRDLARRVMGAAVTPFDRAVRIQDYLRLSYPYDLQVPQPPAGQDVVDYFLFDAPGGFCSYYASAMAVMLRSQGVAARVASGYATGSFDFAARAYRVTPSNSHAWVEVYFSGYGWIEFEPTPSLDRIRYETTAASDYSTAPLPARPTPPAPIWQGLALAAAALIFPLALFGLTYWLRARRRRPGAAEPPERQAERHYLRLRRLLGWAGLGAPASATPAEYLRATAPALAGRGPLPAALQRATELYQQAVYSPHPPAGADVDLARRLAGNSWTQWVGLLLNGLWQRIRS